MIHSVQQIKFEIFGQIKEFGSQFNEWYVGVSSDPAKALFEEHGVDRETDVWLYKQALTFTACQTVQRYFLQNLKTDGIEVSEANEDTDCVYLYKKSHRTKP